MKEIDTASLDYQSGRRAGLLEALEIAKEQVPTTQDALKTAVRDAFVGGAVTMQKICADLIENYGPADSIGNHEGACCIRNLDINYLLK